MTDTGDYSNPIHTRFTHQPHNWRGPVLAISVAALIVLFAGTVVLLGTFGSSETATAPTAVSTAAPIDVGVEHIAESWNPIMTEKVATTSPVSATCPVGANPDKAGSDLQITPGTLSIASNQPAVFDSHRGRIVLVDGFGETWTFDVCTNTWQHMDVDDDPWQFSFDGSALRPRPGDLVYDVDSDVTIALGAVGAYDAESNTWSKMDSNLRTGPSSSDLLRGAVYDPVSGLVIVALHGSMDSEQIMLKAFDVESDTWTHLGKVEVQLGSFLIGYSLATDELIFNGVPWGPGDDETAETALVNPRNGSTTVLNAPGPEIFSPWGIWYPYANGVEGAVLIDDNDIQYSNDGQFDNDSSYGLGDVCRFDTGVRAWDNCPIDTSDGPHISAEQAAMAYDTINERLVVIFRTGAVWAVDLDSGTWIQLL